MFQKKTKGSFGQIVFFGYVFLFKYLKLQLQLIMSYKVFPIHWTNWSILKLRILKFHLKTNKT